MVRACGFDVFSYYISDGLFFHSVLCRHVALVKYFYLLFFFVWLLIVGESLVDSGLDCFLDVAVLVAIVDEDLSQSFQFFVCAFPRCAVGKSAANVGIDSRTDIALRALAISVQT